MRRRIVGLAGVLLAAASAGKGQDLVADGGFASDLGAWHHDPVEGGSSAWSSQDAGGSASSGSALLTGTAATEGVFIALLTQCVPHAEDSFQQTGAADFAGVSLEDGQSLKITAEPEFLILYGATVDNVTNDPSAQFLTPYRALQR